jgi:hypothetical protein
MATANPGGFLPKVRVNSQEDDAEEKSKGPVNIKSPNLKMVEIRGNQTIGLRFNCLDRPPAGSSNRRTAVSWDDSASQAPLLHVEYTLGGQAYSIPLTGQSSVVPIPETMTALLERRDFMN